MNVEVCRRHIGTQETLYMYLQTPILVLTRLYIEEKTLHSHLIKPSLGNKSVGKTEVSHLNSDTD
jgi:hypothetical protein